MTDLSPPPTSPTLKGQDFELDNSTDIDIEHREKGRKQRCAVLILNLRIIQNPRKYGVLLLFFTLFLACVLSFPSRPALISFMFPSPLVSIYYSHHYTHTYTHTHIHTHRHSRAHTHTLHNTLVPLIINCQ